MVIYLQAGHREDWPALLGTAHTSDYAHAINSIHTVVGDVGAPEPADAFAKRRFTSKYSTAQAMAVVFDPKVEAKYLTGEFHIQGTARDINDHGTIVGVKAATGSDVERAFIYRGKGLEYLSDFSSPPVVLAPSAANGVNNTTPEKVVGRAQGGTMTTAVLWEAFLARDLGASLSGTTKSEAFDINDHDQVVGDSDKGAFFVRVFAPNIIPDHYYLGTIADPNGSDSHAYGINNNSFVVGTADAGANIHFSIDKRMTVKHIVLLGRLTHAFLWDYASKKMRDLGTLMPHDIAGRFNSGNSTAYDINDNNEVVGESDTGTGTPHAFYWNETIGMVDLNAAVSPPDTSWKLTRATSISNDGWIAGWGTHGTAQTRAWLLAPQRWVVPMKRPDWPPSWLTSILEYLPGTGHKASSSSSSRAASPDDPVSEDFLLALALNQIALRMNDSQAQQRTQQLAWELVNQQAQRLESSSSEKEDERERD